MYVVGYGEDLSGSDSGKDWWVKKFYSDGTEDTDWEQILDTGGLDDEALAVAVDGYNNVIVAGYSTDTDGSSGKDWRIVKYTSLGNVSWNKTYSIASSDDVIQDIVVDDDGNIYAAGYFYSSQSARDWHIKKLS
ncbi:MAG: hypothetical protein K9L66_12730 [Spirochaetaceae bacterium]|nr:hypothetical protein [Spirochaetaceae bacterium]